MSHWPAFRLVTKARRPEPAAGPVGRSPVHAARAAISRTDRTGLTPPPKRGSAAKLARRERVRQRGRILRRSRARITIGKTSPSGGAVCVSLLFAAFNASSATSSSPVDVVARPDARFGSAAAGRSAGGRGISERFRVAHETPSVRESDYALYHRSDHAGRRP